jgi:hypothetical protein
MTQRRRTGMHNNNHSVAPTSFEPPKNAKTTDNPSNFAIFLQR